MCAAPFWMMCGIQFLTGAGCLLALGQRSKVRDRYGIRGDGFKGSRPPLPHSNLRLTRVHRLPRLVVLPALR